MPEADIMVALHGAVFIRRMVKHVGRKQRIRRGKVFVLPFKVLFLRKHIGRQKEEDQEKSNQSVHVSHI